MPTIRHRTNERAAFRARYGALSDNHVPTHDIRPCVGDDHCAGEPIPGCPVSLCGKHLNEVYAFASDYVSERWDGAVREYVSELHGQFKPPAVLKQPKAGWVYFIRFGDRVKVGYTTDPTKRLKGLPHEEVLGVIPGSRADEAAWHKLLADFHVVGEWFQATPDVLAGISRVIAAAA